MTTIVSMARLAPAYPAQAADHRHTCASRMYVLAENMGLDLEDELYVLARYLISTDRARLVDAVRPSLRNIFMPNTTTDSKTYILLAYVVNNGQDGILNNVRQHRIQR
jgi:hypothetical protein